MSSRLKQKLCEYIDPEEISCQILFSLPVAETVRDVKIGYKWNRKHTKNKPRKAGSWHKSWKQTEISV